MKSKLVVFNLLLLGFFIPFVGGGAITKLGYFFLLAALLLSFPLFGNIAKSALFNKSTTYLYFFLLFYLISSMMDALGCVAIFGRICAPIFCAILYGVISKHPQLAKTQRFFVVLWFIVICFFEVQSLKFIAENPQGLRELVSTKKDDSLIIGGGYSLPYALSLLVPALVLACKTVGSKMLKIVLLCLCVFFSFFVFSALYMTAIILMLLGVGLALLHGYPRTKKIFLMSCLAVIAMLSYGFIPILIEEFQPEGTGVLMRRFNEIDSILAGNDLSESEDFFSRIQLSLTSIGTFLENPLFGIGWKSGYDFFELEKAGVGSHAEWFDIFACYGLFAFLLIGYLKNAAKPFMKKENIAMTLFVILGFLNPCLQFTIVFVVYCLVPLTRILFVQSGNQRLC